MTADDRELVYGYIRNISVGVEWIDWYFRYRDSPAGACLHQALFEDELTRDLSQPAVREAVVKCVEDHADLFAHVLEQANATVDRLAGALVNLGKDSPPAQPVADVRPCKCGLVTGQVIVLKKDLPIHNYKGEQTALHKAGETWTVLGPEFEDNIVWLRRPDGEPHTWDDDASIFEFFEVLSEPSGQRS
jgi:hypothetical protein